MLRRAVEFIERCANARGIAAALAASVVFGVLPLSYAIQRIQARSPDAAPLDMADAYTADEAYAMIGRYGDDARDYYVFNAFTADVIGPALFGLTIALVGVALLRRLTPPGSPWRGLAVVGPLVAWAIDVVENGLLATLVARYPERLDALAEWASLITTTKRALIYSTWALVVGAALVLAAVTLRRGTTGRPPA